LVVGNRVRASALNRGSFYFGLLNKNDLTTKVKKGHKGKPKSLSGKGVFWMKTRFALSLKLVCAPNRISA
jgi:hypothetical protein